MAVAVVVREAMAVAVVAGEAMAVAVVAGEEKRGVGVRSAAVVGMAVSESKRVLEGMETLCKSKGLGRQWGSGRWGVL